MDLAPSTSSASEYAGDHASGCGVSFGVLRRWKVRLNAMIEAGLDIDHVVAEDHRGGG